MDQQDIKEVVVRLLLVKLNEECTCLCRRTSTSLFHSIPVDHLANFNWKNMAAELEQKAPLLITLLHSITVRNDLRNTAKTGTAHYPGICFAAAILLLLKERNREMCGLQSLVSLLMYSCHAEKQVNNIMTNQRYTKCLSLPLFCVAVNML